jgi:hypothetical protein
MRGHTFYQWDAVIRDWPVMLRLADRRGTGRWVISQREGSHYIKVGPGKYKLCRKGDYMISNPDGTWFQDLDYLEDYTPLPHQVK